MKWKLLARVRSLVQLAIVAILSVGLMTLGSPQVSADDPAQVWIEFSEFGNSPYSRIFASSWYRSQYDCDSPPDSDYDYVFVFNLPGYTTNFASLRHAATDANVNSWIVSNLKAYGRNNYEVRLCMGPERVEAPGAGGVNAFFSSVYIHFNGSGGGDRRR